MTEVLRTLPAQKAFVPRISHSSDGTRIIPLLAAGAGYDSQPFTIRGYNKLEIFNRSDRRGQIYVYMGPNPVSLLMRAPGDGTEKALFMYGELAGQLQITEFGDDQNQLDDWSFSGVVIGTNTDANGRLYILLSDVAGTRTVSVYMDVARTQLVAEGSLVGDGVITLIEQNLSGLSGSVNVTYVQDDNDIWLQLETVSPLVEQFSVQAAADYARVIYVNDTIGPQTIWEFQIQLKPVAEPDGIRVYDEELIGNPLTTVYKYLTLTPDYRLRVDGEFTPTSIQLVQGKRETKVWAAENAGVLEDETYPVAANDGRFSIGPAVIAGHVSVEGSLKEFTIFAAIRNAEAGGAGDGWIVIEYMTGGAGAWMELDRLSLAAAQTISRRYAATAERYRVYYLASSNTTGFDGALFLKPQT